MNFSIIQTNCQNSDFIKFCKLLNDFQNTLIPERVKFGFDSVDGVEVADVFLAYDGEKPIGCAALRCYKNQIGELIRVYIDENYRGHRVAEALCKEIEKLAKEKGYKTIVLDTWTRSEAALRLYNRLGYKKTNEYQTEEGDALPDLIVIMKKDLI